MGLCNVETCSNKSGMPGIRTVSFPSNPELKRKWIAAIDNKRIDLSSVKFPRICSAHFTPSCWDFLEKPPALVAGSVPTIFCRCPSRSLPNEDTAAKKASVLHRETPTVGRTVVKRSKNGGRPKRIDKINHRRECPFYPQLPSMPSHLQTGGPENLDPNSSAVNSSWKIAIPRTPGPFKQNSGQGDLLLAQVPPGNRTFYVLVTWPDGSAGKNSSFVVPDKFKQSGVPENVAVNSSAPSGGSPGEIIIPRIPLQFKEDGKPGKLPVNSSAPSDDSPEEIRIPRIPSQLKEDGEPGKLPVNSSAPSDDLSGKAPIPRTPSQFKEDGEPVKLPVNSSAPSDDSPEEIRIPRVASQLKEDGEPGKLPVNSSAPSDDSPEEIRIPRVASQLKEDGEPGKLPVNSSAPPVDLSGKVPIPRIPSQCKKNGEPENLAVNFSSPLDDLSRKERNFGVPVAEPKPKVETDNSNQGAVDEKLSMFWFDSL